MAWAAAAFLVCAAVLLSFCVFLPIDRRVAFIRTGAFTPPLLALGDKNLSLTRMPVVTLCLIAWAPYAGVRFLLRVGESHRDRMRGDLFHTPDVVVTLHGAGLGAGPLRSRAVLAPTGASIFALLLGLLVLVFERLGGLPAVALSVWCVWPALAEREPSVVRNADTILMSGFAKRLGSQVRARGILQGWLKPYRGKVRAVARPVVVRQVYSRLKPAPTERVLSTKGRGWVRIDW